MITVRLEIDEDGDYNDEGDSFLRICSFGLYEQFELDWEEPAHKIELTISETQHEGARIFTFDQNIRLGWDWWVDFGDGGKRTIYQHFGLWLVKNGFKPGKRYWMSFKELP